MSTKPLPSGLPSAMQVQAQLEEAHLALEALQHTMLAALAMAHGHIERLLANDATPDELLKALRTIHETAQAMVEPAQELFTQLLEAQLWAERLSWDVLAVPLYETTWTTPAVAGEAWWLDERVGYGAGVN